MHRNAYLLPLVLVLSIFALSAVRAGGADEAAKAFNTMFGEDVTRSSGDT